MIRELSPYSRIVAGNLLDKNETPEHTTSLLNYARLQVQYQHHLPDSLRTARQSIPNNIERYQISDVKAFQQCRDNGSVLPGPSSPAFPMPALSVPTLPMPASQMMTRSSSRSSAVIVPETPHASETPSPVASEPASPGQDTGMIKRRRKRTYKPGAKIDLKNFHPTVPQDSQIPLSRRPSLEQLVVDKFTDSFARKVGRQSCGMIKHFTTGVDALNAKEGKPPIDKDDAIKFYKSFG